MDGWQRLPLKVAFRRPIFGRCQWSVYNCFDGYSHRLSICDTVFQAGAHSFGHQDDSPEPESKKSDPLDSVKDVTEDVAKFIDAVEFGLKSAWRSAPKQSYQVAPSEY